MADQQQKAIAPSSSGGDRPLPSVYSPHSSQSRKLQSSGSQRPCPICGRTKDADCRWNDEVALCHTYIYQDAGIAGYVYRGAKNIWGQYFPEDSAQKPIRPKAEKEFIYHDQVGKPLVKVTRKDNGNGSRKIFQSHWTGEKWQKGVPDEVKAKLRLYKIAEALNQDAIAHQKPILIVEGEGKVDLLLSLEIPATCAIGGAGKWRAYGYPNYEADLKGAKVVLCPDRDIPGVKHCLDIEQDFPDSQWLLSFPSSSLWERLPQKNGLDIADWVASEKLEADAILGAIAPTRPPFLEKLDSPEIEAEEQPEKKTLAQLLIEIAEEGEYFHTPDQKAYADIQIDGIRKTFPVRSKIFKQWLQRQLYLQHNKSVGSETLNQVLGLLESKATFEGKEHKVYLRIAEHEGKVYLDLGTDDWTAIEIDTDGWRLILAPPVRFRRVDNLLLLPMPEKGGHLSELRELVNMDEDAWILALNWLLFSFYPKYPHPILLLHGEQGTGKSYTARLLKALIDPGKAPLIPNVADLRNLAIQAENRWILAYDNLSFLSAEHSDALCRISTGGGFSTRTLYENDQETVFEFIRPQIVTGIDDLATRGDLLERSLLVSLNRIPEEKRLTEAELEKKLEYLRGRILGALLTALSQTLKVMPNIQPDRLPRMADFAKFAIAAETALDLPVGSFLRVYAGNREEAHQTALESSPVAIAIQRLMENRLSWKGTPTELLATLNGLTDEKTTKKNIWPGTTKALGKALKRLAPDLRGIGLEVASNRSSSSRSYQIDKIPISTSQKSLMSQAPPDKGSEGDVELGIIVMDDYRNVTHDKTDYQQGHLSLDGNSNVTSETSINQGFQGDSDNHDVCDKENTPSSNWVGRQVKKRGKVGWVGKVQAIRGHWVDVLWVGDRQPSSVSIDELELIA